MNDTDDTESAQAYQQEQEHRSWDELWGLHKRDHAELTKLRETMKNEPAPNTAKT